MVCCFITVILTSNTVHFRR